MTGPEQHADTVREGLGWADGYMQDRCISDAEHASVDAELAACYASLAALVALAERADTLERERDEAQLEVEFLLSDPDMTSIKEWVEQASAEAERLREAAKYAVRMLNDPDEREIGEVIEGIDQAVAALSAALAGPQTKEQT